MTPALFLTDPTAKEVIVNRWIKSDVVFVLTKRANKYLLWGVVKVANTTRLQNGWVSVRLGDREEFQKKRTIRRLFYQRRVPTACLINLEEY
jgi:hypothetical protein